VETFLQLLVNGLSFGAIYAMVAVGLTIVFGILEVVNFAQGEFYMLGAYITYLVLLAHLPYPVSIISAIAVMTLVGLVVERCAIRPLIGKAWQLPILSTLAISIIIQNGAIVLWTPNPRTISVEAASRNINVLGVVITYQRLLVILWRWPSSPLSTTSSRRQRPARRCGGLPEQGRLPGPRH
jgi:branched-chain amino acid transport system permease protein